MDADSSSLSKKCSLSNDEIARYSRQLILPEIGADGQEKIKKGKVLIVGVGGLGCPASLYLAAAGVGTLGLLDYDTVEVNNLHRQILHTEDSIGLTKVRSASNQIKRMNSSVKCVEHHESLDSNSAIEIIKGYDIVIDASDNVPTRYLVNDSCVLAGKPLISGSALRFEGQLTTYNYKDGPCYRCLYPQPPPAETVTNCSDGGVIGAVTGFIGSLQALETIKVLAGIGSSYQSSKTSFSSHSYKPYYKIFGVGLMMLWRQPTPFICHRITADNNTVFVLELEGQPCIVNLLFLSHLTFPFFVKSLCRSCNVATFFASYSRKLLMFDGFSGDIRTIKLRAKKDDCPVCGKEPSIKRLEDYEVFCGSCATDKTRTLNLLPDSERVSVQEYKRILDSKEVHILFDVRPDHEFAICSLKNAKNFPINDFSNGEIFQYLKEVYRNGDQKVFVLCKQGNDSQKAVLQLKERLISKSNPKKANISFKDIIGGLTAWSSQVDKDFPNY